MQIVKLLIMLVSPFPRPFCHIIPHPETPSVRLHHLPSPAVNRTTATYVLMHVTSTGALAYSNIPYEMVRGDS